MTHATPPCTQRGAAALIVTLLLFLALALLAFGMNRHLLIEQRSATNQARAAQAFEVAEGGLDWAQGALNDMRRVGPDCRPSTDAAALTFRARYLQLDRASGVISPTSGQAACVGNANGWSCRCDGQAAPPTGAEGNPIAPSFTVIFQPGPRAGTVRIAATSSAAPDAASRIEATLGLYAGLRTAPGNAITTRDMTDLTIDRFFSAWFGIDKASWRDQPAVRRITCPADCGRDVEAAIGSGHELIWIDGDATLAGPLALGSPEHPVVLVASGSMRLDNGVAIHGVAYAGSVMLAGTGNVVHGAVLSEGLYVGPTDPAVHLDVDVLSALTHQTGSFVRIPGSWRDF
jgi:Tfp pilus assembly protein PilX